jgi:hypothetical protein
MNTGRIVKSIGEHELLIFEPINQVYVPNGRAFYKDYEIDKIIQILNLTKEFYLKNKEILEFHEKISKVKSETEFSVSAYNLKNKKKSAHQNRKTQIYVMRDNHTGHYKIGRSDSPVKREATLLSQKSSIELLFYAEAIFDYEKRLHDLFADKRIRGEWFDLSQGDVELIKNLLS